MQRSSGAYSQWSSISLEDLTTTDDMGRKETYGGEPRSFDQMYGLTTEEYCHVSADLTDFLPMMNMQAFNPLPPSSFSKKKKSKDGGESSQRSAAEETDTGDKIKMKLMSAWNNVKYSWTVKTKTNFKLTDPLWFLGKCYHRTMDECYYSDSAADTKNRRFMEHFKQDFVSRIWFTYRKDFGTLKTSSSGLTSDVGWGCMLRTAQMILAQALVVHFLGRDWRLSVPQRPQEHRYHMQILALFGDLDSVASPLGIHQLTRIGSEMGKIPGDWYGPASAAHVLRTAVCKASTISAPSSTISPLLAQICVYVSQDCTVYKGDVIDQCTQFSPSGKRHSSASSSDVTPWRACVILIPVRLGGEALNSVYIPCLQSALAHDLCLGIIGGKPRHSLYFCGWQGDKLVYMDPHLCQPAVDTTARDFPHHSFHCLSPRKTAFAKIDPSCTIGFYCNSLEQFERLCEEAESFSSPPKEKGLYPMFVFHPGRSSDVTTLSQPVNTCDRIVRVQHVDSRGRATAPPNAKDDFVFL